MWPFIIKALRSGVLWRDTQYDADLVTLKRIKSEQYTRAQPKKVSTFKNQEEEKMEKEKRRR